MNKEVVRQVKAMMKEDGITQDVLAERMQVERIYVNRMLTASTSLMPKRWRQLLDVLGLEVVIQRKQKR
ncbi:helix-turn-helix domain-containing protein [Deinococcus radiotolerans]|uniref:HTH cro/C1-type domain-containing protein n=1 Tax=Deinococcus radiotolerans TaxID=1309407 RepID=A0ABQ2FQA7_9DEIO|nr:helix-turn-helix transcriptional regulator [Deinococcus radiotolerans]GGL16021.1 hypothetical protein GCM10010844_38640 [Deinococcus radiotolerans]